MAVGPVVPAGAVPLTLPEHLRQEGVSLGGPTPHGSGEGGAGSRGPTLCPCPTRGHLCGATRRTGGGRPRSDSWLENGPGPPVAPARPVNGVWAHGGLEASCRPPGAREPCTLRARSTSSGVGRRCLRSGYDPRLIGQTFIFLNFEFNRFS